MPSKTTKPAPATKAALKRNSNGRFATKSARLTSTRRTRAAKPAVTKGTMTAKRPRVSQRLMAPNSKRAIEAVQVKADSYKVQVFAFGMICGLTLFTTGLFLGWFMRG